MLPVDLCSYLQILQDHISDLLSYSGQDVRTNRNYFLNFDTIFRDSIIEKKNMGTCHEVTIDHGNYISD